MDSAVVESGWRVLGAAQGREADARANPPPEESLNVEQRLALRVLLAGPFTRDRLRAGGLTPGGISRIYSGTNHPEPYADVLSRHLGLIAQTQGEAPVISPVEGLIRSGWRTLTAAELKADPPRLEFLWEGFIPAGKAGVLAGAGGGGKTSLLVGLAVARAVGGEFLGRKVKRGSTVLVSTEDSLEDYWRKLTAIREATPGLDLAAVADRVHICDLSGKPFQLVNGRGGQFSPSEASERLAAVVKEKAPGADLIIMETVSRLGGDESNPAMSALMVAAEQVAQITGAAVLLVAHVSKAAARERFSDAHSARGGSAISDNARYVLVLSKADERVTGQLREAGISREETEDLLVLTLAKGNFAAPTEPILLERNPNAWGLTLRPYGPKGAGGVAAGVEAGRRLVGKRLKEVVEELIGQGVTVTETKLRDDHRGRIGLAKARVKEAVLAAILDGYLVRGAPTRGGGTELLPGSVEPAHDSRPGESLVLHGTGGGAWAAKKSPSPSVLRGEGITAVNEQIYEAKQAESPEAVQDLAVLAGRVADRIAVVPVLEGDEIANRLEVSIKESSDALQDLGREEPARHEQWDWAPRADYVEEMAI